MKNISQIEIAWHLCKEKTKPDIIAKRLGVHRSTVYRWIKRFRYIGLKRTIEHYENCKKRSRRKWKTTGVNKSRIYEIRNKRRNCCGEKIRYFLKKEYGIEMSVETIYKVLREKYQLRSKYKRNKYGEAPKGKEDREVVQADTVDFGEVYAYTYIDTYTRQAVVDLELGLESEDGYASMTVAKKRMNRIKLLQVDGGPEFKGVFKRKVKEIADNLRVSRPYKKNEQSFVESFNRSLRKECLGWRKYKMSELGEMKCRVEEYMQYYNNVRPHLGLDMKTPNEVAICRI